MGTPKPTLGYPSRADAILALWKGGLTIRDIARKIDVSASNVSTVIYSRGGEKRSRTRTTVRIGGAIRERLNAEAAERNLDPEVLAKRILETVLRERLLAAVLDDGDAP